MGQTKKRISMAEIVLAKRLKARAGGLCQEHVADLAAAYKRGDEIEPPRVWRCKGMVGFHLTRGRHRHAAHKKLGYKEMECEVKDGDFADALLDAVNDNQTHGLRRSNKDKRQCVVILLAKFTDWSSRKLAEAAGVSHTFVDEVKEEVATVATHPKKGLKKPSLSPAAREAYRPLLELVKNPPDDAALIRDWVTKLDDLAVAFRLIREGES
jgi:hypothetical protein